MNSTRLTLDDATARKCELATEILRSSGNLRLRVTGWSMLPVIWPGDTLVIERASGDSAVEGDIVMFSNGRRLVAHRVVTKSNGSADSMVHTQGDALSRPDSPVAHHELLGKVSFIMRNGELVKPARSLCLPQRAVAAVFRRSTLAARVVVGVHGLRRTSQVPACPVQTK
jgi:signal peptidase I